MIRLLTTLFLMTCAFAQPPDTVWTRIYSRNLDQEAHTALSINDGGLIVVGTTGNYPDYDIYALRIDVAGDTLWTGIYGTEDRDVAEDVVAAHNGGWMIAGWVYRGGTDGDMFTMKLDSTGLMEWREEYDGGSWEIASDIAATPDGGYVVSGTSWGLGAGLGDIYVVKTDSLSHEEWCRRYGWPYNDNVYDAIPVTGGGYLFVGSTNVEWANRDGIILRADENGDTLWSRTFGGAGDDDLNGVTPVAGGGYMLSGQISTYANYNSADFWLIRTDDDGNTLWDRTYGGEYNDWPSSILQTPDSGFIVVGWTQSFQVGGTKSYVVRTNVIGDTLWTRILGTDSDVRAMAVQLAPNLDYFVAGHSGSSYAGSYDFYVIRIEQDVETAVSERNVVLSPQDHTLSTYPNPFNSTVTIRYELSSSAEVRVSIFNLLGEKVAVLQDSRQSAGAHSVTWSPGVSSGIYLVGIEAGGAMKVKKLVYLK